MGNRHARKREMNAVHGASGNGVVKCNGHPTANVPSNNHCNALNSPQLDNASKPNGSVKPGVSGIESSSSANGDCVGMEHRDNADGATPSHHIADDVDKDEVYVLASEEAMEVEGEVKGVESAAIHGGGVATMVKPEETVGEPPPPPPPLLCTPLQTPATVRLRGSDSATLRRKFGIHSWPIPEQPSTTARRGGANDSDAKRFSTATAGVACVNDDHLFPDAVTPSKVEMSLTELYDVPFIDDEAFRATGACDEDGEFAMENGDVANVVRLAVLDDCSVTPSDPRDQDDVEI